MKLRVISILVAICLALGLGSGVMAQTTTPTTTIAEVHGTISGVDAGAKTVTIAPDSGSAAVTLNVTDSTKIKVNGIDNATIIDLKVGQKIEAKYEVVPATATAASYNKALKIEAKGLKLKKVKINGIIEQTATQITGNLVTIRPTKGSPEPVTLVVNANTKIEVAGEGRTTFASLRVGQRAEAQYKVVPATATAASYNKALKIEAKKLRRMNIQGEITQTQIAGNLVTIKPNKGDAVTLTVTAATRTKVSGNNATFTDLKVGQRAEAQYEVVPAIGSAPAVNYALKIEVETPKPLNVNGEITQTQIAGNLVTIKPKKGDAVTLTVTAATRIEVSGNNATFGDLKVGQRAEAQYEVIPATGVNNALKIEAQASNNAPKTEGKGHKQK